VALDRRDRIVAAVLAVVYLLLAINSAGAAGFAAFVSSCLYVWVLFGARLYMESALNAFYAAMAVYGYWQWSRGEEGRQLRISRWPPARNALGLLGVVGLSCVSSFFLRRFTPAAWPFVDSMVTWASVFAHAVGGAQGVRELALVAGHRFVSLCLYFNRRLYLTMLCSAVPADDRRRHARVAPQSAAHGSCPQLA